MMRLILLITYFIFLLIQQGKAQEMVFVQGGTFTMGCTLIQKTGCAPSGGSCCDWELPNRQVSLSDYRIGKYEVTQGEWTDLFGNNPSGLNGCGNDCPVEKISWLDALAYCNRLSESKGYEPCYYTDWTYTQIYGKSGNTWILPNQNITIYWRENANGYHLPTEAQWEYAARGGNKSTNKEFAGSNNIDDVAWHGGKPGNTIHLKGTKNANELNIFDLSGNVLEWCFDSYSDSPYPNANNCCNPTAPDCGTLYMSSGKNRVLRGGSWNNPINYSRVSFRHSNFSEERYYSIGFRLAQSFTKGLNPCANSMIDTSSCRYKDSLQLVKLYNTTNGVNWANKWDLKKPMNTWYGIKLSATSCVEWIDMDGTLDGFNSTPNEKGNNLTGTLTNLNIKTLKSLILPKNSLSGSVPVFNLPNLEQLWLWSNQLSGNIPSFNTPKLKKMSFYNNQLSGFVPNFNFPDLEEITLTGNKLTGTIPIPSSLKLSVYYLNGNNLSGCFPDPLKNYCSKSKFNFIGNPKLPWQGDFSKFCANEPQTGAPCDDGNTNTTNDKIDANCLCKGELPTNTSTCRYKDSLQLVTLYNATNGANWNNKWDLKKPINTWYGITLTMQGCVEKIDLSINQLSGTLPNFNLVNLVDLDLAFNQLSGTIPNFNLPNLVNLELNSNQLKGTIPNFNLPKVVNLYLSGNQLSSTIPNFNLLNLEDLRLDFNQLSSSIPDFNLPNLKILGLSENKLSGTIPNFNLLKLESLGLENNQLSGTIPNFNLLNLRALNSANNKLNGMIPNFNLPKLKYLYLNNNKLNGAIPNFNLPDLETLALSNNQLSGVIPNFNLPNLVDLRSELNQLSGAIPNFNLLKLKFLQLSNNQLSSTIPNFNLPDLNILYLSNNQLSGCFDIGLKKYCSISIKDFSNNPKLPWQGDFSKFCANEPQTGAPCDDGDPKTLDDKIDANCECKGKACATALLNVSAGSDYTLQCPDEKYTLAQGVQNISTYKYQWGTSNGSILTGANTLNAVVNKPGTYTLTVTETASTCTTVLKVNISKFIDVKANAGKEQTICGDQAKLNADLPTGNTGIWSIVSGSANITDVKDPKSNISALKAGITELRWTLSKNNCPNYASATTKISSEQARMEAIADLSYVAEGQLSDTIDLIANDKFNGIKNWDITITKQPFTGTLSALSKGIYQYDFNSTNIGNAYFDYKICSINCKDTCSTAKASVIIKRKINTDSGVQAPVVVTPNGDGLNDNFIVDEIDKYPKNKFYVYSRWGSIVWQGKLDPTGWPGVNQDGQKLPDGTYYYVIQLDLAQGKTIFGDILLLSE